MSDVTERITTYLINGGAFNPELADHSAVRDLLIDARAELAAQADVHTQIQMQLSDERDALHAALRIAKETLIEALEYIDDPYNELAVYIGKRLVRIETTMNKGDFDRDIRADQRAFRDFGYTPGGRKLSIGERIKHAESRALNKGGGDE